MNFFSLGVEGRIKQDHYLIKLNKLIDWTKIEKELKGIHVNEINPKGGPKAYNNLSMFKAILLGQWHTLSDPGLEESLTLRLDFMVFTGFELGERVPDETTICRFRHKLIEKKLNDKLFQEIVIAEPSAMLTPAFSKASKRGKEDPEERNPKYFSLVSFGFFSNREYLFF